ncbi:hypothetical protein H261_18944 [Paramagnetospirillum caucaseum]|uniref:Uncharacterized protein n=1 Tax=Paramagnetospirillum caucaseum TaxID=1244869 RepID=M2ZM10_9PROT|nr:hypothetical protein [Paramagnetospirillum caucaseum]EME68317.1 hypothetical protein H261_18944 [Paramagnetospirillum caucaseum]
MSECTYLPRSATIRMAPHELLANLLHAQGNGLPRAHKDATLLAEAICDGWIAIDDVELPWRPMVAEGLVDELLADEPNCHESEAHRRLKVDARLIALATDASAMLEPEAAASQGRHPLRADLLVWHASGLSETYECGATDGRSILTQLMDGQVRVTVLPFSGLGLPTIRGYAFRLTENPAMPALTVEQGLRAWGQMLASLPNINAPTMRI